MNEKELLQQAHDILDQLNADTGGDACQFCPGEKYDGDGIQHVDSCILMRIRRVLNPPRAKEPKDVYTDDELMYAASVRCPCGAGMAYPRGYAVNYWDCSDILTGRAAPSSQPGSVKHEAQLPFAFYEIKSEIQPSAQGATTRPAP